MFDNIEQSGDEASTSLLVEWFNLSGGERLKRDSKHSLEDYCNILKDDIEYATCLCKAHNSPDTAPTVTKPERVVTGGEDETVPRVTPETRTQIQIDVQRSNANSFHQEELRNYLGGLDKEATDARLIEVLMAYTQRNMYPGYAQGMDQIGLFLLALAGENNNMVEVVFWTLCAVIEVLRLPDFYSPPPDGMAGFALERRLLCFLARNRLQPAILKEGALMPLNDVVEAFAPKWLVCMFLDVLPLKTCIYVWDLFFRYAGDVAMLRVCVSLITEASKQTQVNSADEEDDDSSRGRGVEQSSTFSIGLEPQLMDVICDVGNTLTVETLEESLRSGGEWLDSSHVIQLRLGPSSPEAHLHCLVDHLLAHCHHQFYSLYQKQAQAFYEVASTQGVTLEAFSRAVFGANPAVPLTDYAMKRMFELYKTPGRDDDTIPYARFIGCMAILCGDVLEDKIRLFFRIYDTQDQGYLSEAQLYRMISDFVSVMRKGAYTELKRLCKRMAQLHQKGEKFLFVDFREFVTEDAPRLMYWFTKPTNLIKRGLGKVPPQVGGYTGYLRWYAVLGLSFKPVRRKDSSSGDKDGGPSCGIIVTRCKTGGSAYRAGFRMGDIITEINNFPIKTNEDFYTVFPTIPPGMHVHLKVSVYRNEENHQGTDGYATSPHPPRKVNGAKSHSSPPESKLSRASSPQLPTANSASPATLAPTASSSLLDIPEAGAAAPSPAPAPATASSAPGTPDSPETLKPQTRQFRAKSSPVKSSMSLLGTPGKASAVLGLPGEPQAEEKTPEKTPEKAASTPRKSWMSPSNLLTLTKKAAKIAIEGTSNLVGSITSSRTQGTKYHRLMLTLDLALEPLSEDRSDWIASLKQFTELQSNIGLTWTHEVKQEDEDSEEEDSEEHTFIVEEVSRGSPAALAGLKKYDEITHIGGVELSSHDKLDVLLESFAPGDVVPLIVRALSIREGSVTPPQQVTYPLVLVVGGQRKDGSRVPEGEVCRMRSEALLTKDMEIPHASDSDVDSENEDMGNGGDKLEMQLNTWQGSVITIIPAELTADSVG